jgi:hypothetical protein
MGVFVTRIQNHPKKITFLQEAEKTFGKAQFL